MRPSCSVRASDRIRQDSTTRLTQHPPRVLVIIRQASFPKYLSMDHDLSDFDDCCGWHSLGDDLQLSILSVLKQRRDRDSLKAVMQTSRDLRVLASSLISSIVIRDALALAHFPRHAAVIKSMRLCMSPSPDEAHMEPPFMLTWLQSTLAACNRLANVTVVRIELPDSDEDSEPGDEVVPVDPAVMGSLLASIGRACPNLRCLHIDGIDCAVEELVRVMFAAIGQHLPRIVDLQLGLAWGSDVHSYDIHSYDIPGIDWAACLPRGLQTFRSSVDLHHDLLQHLVQMPALVNVAVQSLGDEDTEVQSAGCAWRNLEIDGNDFPSYQTLCRFTAAMPLLHLYCTCCCEVYWGLEATSKAEGPAVAKAAAWLSQTRNYPKELSIGWRSIPDAASAAGIISALAPLSGLVSLGLDYWPVTERTLDELTRSLPNVGKLTLSSCSISSGAWQRLLSLTSVTDLTISRWSFDAVDNSSAIPLAQIIAFVSDVSHPMTLNIRSEAVSEADRAGWEAVKETLEARRRRMGLPKITVYFK